VRQSEHQALRLPPPLILLVDSDREQRTQLCNALALERYRVRAVGSALEAFNACVVEAPDLLVLEVRLPDRSGIDLALHLRSHGWGVPILITTELFRAPWCAQEIEAEGWLAKPVEIAHFLAAVRRFCR
jgi:two-component system, OmpR family, response regulator